MSEEVVCLFVRERDHVITEVCLGMWFPIADVPYSAMWQADTYWLPLVLAGKKVRGRFTYRSGRALTEHDVEEVTKL